MKYPLYRWVLEFHSMFWRNVPKCNAQAILFRTRWVERGLLYFFSGFSKSTLAERVSSQPSNQLVKPTHWQSLEWLPSPMKSSVQKLFCPTIQHLKTDLNDSWCLAFSVNLLTALVDG
jgi:hypothetical protein